MNGLVSSTVGEESPEVEIIASTPLQKSPPAEPPPVRDTKFDESPIHTAPAVSAGLMLPDTAPAPSGTPPIWKAELDQRVASFRRRRAHTRGVTNSNPNLEFDFEESAPEAVPFLEEMPTEEGVITAPELDIDLEQSSTAAPEPMEMGSVELDPPSASDSRPESDEDFPVRAVQPVEFVLDHVSTRDALESAPPPLEIHVAPMTRRIGAGLIDAVVLLSSAAVFAVIFWRAGGHVSSHPLTLMVLTFVTVFQVLVYFGAFTAIINTTPGLLWMGIEVRSIRGGPPTLRQAIWRAFGCLVSASAILLGYIWALFDNENLTWHDRMSETYLAPSDVVSHYEG